MPSLETAVMINTTDRPFVLPSLVVFLLAGRSFAFEAAGWDAFHVSPKPLMTVAYRNFRVFIYRGTEFNSNSTHYYYTPSLILDPTAVKTTYNSFTDNHELIVPVMMWDEAYEKAVQQAIARRTGQAVPLGSIQLLPIHAIRVDTDSHDYHVLNKWMSYRNHHRNVTFRLSCASNETCSAVRQSIHEFPETFVADLHVYSSFRDVRTRKRELMLKREHTSGAEMCTTLLKEHLKYDTVYVHPVDYKELVRGVVQSVIAQESDDDEFISQDQVRIINRLIDSTLEKRRVSTATFTSDMWNAVYWSDEMHCARPDVVTENLSELCNSSSPTIQQIIKKEMSLSAIRNCLAGTGSTGLDISPFTTAAVASSLLSEEDRNELVRVLLQAKGVSKWKGDKFTVIPMYLIRINVSAFRTAIVATTQVTMAPTGFDLSSRIAVVDQQTVAERWLSCSCSEVNDATTDRATSTTANTTKRSTSTTTTTPTKMTAAATTKWFISTTTATPTRTTAATTTERPTSTTTATTTTTTTATTAAARRPSSLHDCSKTSLRHSGAAYWPDFSTVPGGIFCIGNSASPTPNRNFLSFYKYANGTIVFEGTESLNGGFIDFTPYIQAIVGNDYIRTQIHACRKLPDRLRGTLTGSSVYCSRSNPNDVICLRYGADSVVDNDGSLTCMPTDTETLWY